MTEHIRINRRDYVEFFPDGMGDASLDVHLSRIAKDKAWGGDPQLLAFTERYRVDVAVLDTDTMIRYHEGNFNAEDSVCCKL